MINKPLWEFDSHEMCQVMDNIIIAEDGQITVRFLEGTEVDLSSRRKVIMIVGNHCGYSLFFCIFVIEYIILEIVGVVIRIMEKETFRERLKGPEFEAVILPIFDFFEPFIHQESKFNES